MSEIEKVAALLETPNGQEAFLAWASSPITQMMLSAARELAHPAAPSATDPGTIAMALGRTVGASMVVDYLANPYRERVEQQLATMYGADGIMKENGYGE